MGKNLLFFRKRKCKLCTWPYQRSTRKRTSWFCKRFFDDLWDHSSLLMTANTCTSAGCNYVYYRPTVSDERIFTRSCTACLEPVKITGSLPYTDIAVISSQKMKESVETFKFISFIIKPWNWSNLICFFFSKKLLAKLTVVEHRKKPLYFFSSIGQMSLEEQNSNF